MLNYFRYILSFGRNNYKGVPLWVYCNGSDPQGTVLMGCYEEQLQDQNKSALHTYLVTSQGDILLCT